MWDEVLAEPQYESVDLYATGTVDGHYARGLAYAAKGLIQEAEAEQVSEDAKGAHAVVECAPREILMPMKPSFFFVCVRTLGFRPLGQATSGGALGRDGAR